MKDEKLIERTVQVICQDYLSKYYAPRTNPKRMYSNIEERTKHKFGMKRADGLLAYPGWFGRAYVVSMESKSHKTLAALKPYRSNLKWVLDSLKFGFYALVLSGGFFLLFSGGRYSPFVQYGLPLLIWVLVAFLYGFWKKNSYLYQEMDVLKQVFRYPANEKWISFSFDALEMIAKPSREQLFKICAARGVGVLLVDANKKVHLVATPKKTYKFIKDFLIYYHNEAEIRKKLAGK